MKKLLFCFFICLVAVSLMAQEPTKWHEGLGVRVGTNLSSIRGGMILDKLKSGYMAQVSYKLKLPGDFGLTPALCFSTKGGKDFYSDQAGGGRMFMALKLSYIQIPVMINCDFKFGNFCVTPALGGYYAYCLGSRIWSSDGFSGSWLDSNDPQHKLLNRSDAGLRFNVDFAWKRFVVGLGYDLGLLDITANYLQDDKFVRLPLNLDWKTSSLFLTLGWNF